MRNLRKRKSSLQIESLFYVPVINGTLIKAFVSSGAATSCRMGSFNLYLFRFKCPVTPFGKQFSSQGFMTY